LQIEAKLVALQILVSHNGKFTTDQEQCTAPKMEMKWGQHQSTKKAHEKNLQRI
jgi:hypothetical protein